jgi:hypothetical protein
MLQYYKQDARAFQPWNIILARFSSRVVVTIVFGSSAYTPQIAIHVAGFLSSKPMTLHTT